MKKLFLLSFTLVALASCSDEDTVAPPVATAGPSAGSFFGTADHPLNLGGPNEQNQVYVDLSAEAAQPVARDSWDFGFYSGSDFRVVLNGSLRMAVKQLATSDISLAQTADETVAIGTFDPANLAYVDNPAGNLDGTAFGNIAASEAAAKVYLVNLGNKVPTLAPAAGSSNVAGDPRGWKKVKIWKDGNGYKLQYADLDSQTPAQVSITKDPAYNHVFYSLAANSTVQAEPKKENWDMNFTTFTNEVFQGTESAGAYFYSDFVVINTRAGVTAYKAEGNAEAYEAFTMADVNNSSFSSDQRAIGANWRNVVPVQLYDNVFFVLKDGEGNMYKIKFVSMLNSAGERGFPLFEYKLL